MRWTTRAGGLAASSPRHTGSVPITIPIAVAAIISPTGGRPARRGRGPLLGPELEIGDRKTEADLAATGCTPLIGPQARGVLLFDIGGGSSELGSLAQSEPAVCGPPRPVVRSWVSLPVGVVTLAERHGGVWVDRALFEVMVAEVAGRRAQFPPPRGAHPVRVPRLRTSRARPTLP